MNQIPPGASGLTRRYFMGAACVAASLLCLPPPAFARNILAGRMTRQESRHSLPDDLELTGYRYSEGRRIKLMRSRSNSFLIYELDDENLLHK